MLEKEIRESKAYEREKKAEELKFLKLQEENMRKFLEAVRDEREAK